jgi:hypothetical protein
MSPITNNVSSIFVVAGFEYVTNKPAVPVNPGGKAELYGYKEITGNAVGSTGARGPSSLIRLHNADSYAYLACGMSPSRDSRLIDSGIC